MSVSITCGFCGHTAPYHGFLTYGGKPLPPRQTHCKACDGAVELRKVDGAQRLVTIRKPRLAA
jgi:hypothetical protein